MSKKKIVKNPIDTYKKSHNTLKGGSWLTLKGRGTEISYRAFHSTMADRIGFAICLKRK